jgi:DNA replication protein DnaC
MVPRHVIVWRDKPERCTCQKAQDYWKRWDAKEEARKAHEEIDRQKQEEMRRFESLMNRSGMKGRFQSRRFDNFVCDTDGRKQAFSQAKRYADNFTRMRPVKSQRGKVTPPEIERNGLFIAGSYGTGKTHLAAAIANELIRNGTAVICMTMIDLLDQIRATYKARRSMDGDVDEAFILQQYQDVPLLIIDDIGSEQPTEWCVSKIFAIINARYEGYMPTIITTNYSGEELEHRMTPEGGDDRNAKKTLDRLKEMCVGIDMTWESWRVR